MSPLATLLFSPVPTDKTVNKGLSLLSHLVQPICTPKNYGRRRQCARGYRLLSLSLLNLIISRDS